MKKVLLWFGLAAVLVGLCFALRASADDAHAAKPCARKTFDTKMIGAACKRGGQLEAKKVAKAFLKKRKRADLGCATCHAKVGGDYPLKTGALRIYWELGGI